MNHGFHSDAHLTQPSINRGENKFAEVATVGPRECPEIIEAAYQ
jgi:hypothetical protein